MGHDQLKHLSLFTQNVAKLVWFDEKKMLKLIICVRSCGILHGIHGSFAPWTLISVEANSWDSIEI